MRICPPASRRSRPPLSAHCAALAMASMTWRCMPEAVEAREAGLPGGTGIFSCLAVGVPFVCAHIASRSGRCAHWEGMLLESATTGHATPCVSPCSTHGQYPRYPWLDLGQFSDAGFALLLWAWQSVGYPAHQDGAKPAADRSPRGTNPASTGCGPAPGLPTKEITIFRTAIPNLAGTSRQKTFLLCEKGMQATLRQAGWQHARQPK